MDSAIPAGRPQLHIKFLPVFLGRGAVEGFGLPRRGDLCQHTDSWGWRILEAVPHARPAFPVAGEPHGQLSPTPHSRNPAGTCPVPFPGYQGHLPHLAGHMAVLSGTGLLPLRGGGCGWVGHRVRDQWTGRRRASGADVPLCGGSLVCQLGVTRGICRAGPGPTVTAVTAGTWQVPHRGGI